MEQLFSGGHDVVQARGAHSRQQPDSERRYGHDPDLPPAALEDVAVHAAWDACADCDDANCWPLFWIGIFDSSLRHVENDYNSEPFAWKRLEVPFLRKLCTSMYGCAIYCTMRAGPTTELLAWNFLDFFDTPEPFAWTLRSPWLGPSMHLS